MTPAIRIRWRRVAAALVLAAAAAGGVAWYLGRAEPREFAIDRLSQQQLVAVVQKSPADELAWSTLGRRLLVGGSPADAERAFRSALAAQPASLRAAAGYACSVALQGDWKRGSAMMKELEGSNPPTADLYFYRGLLLASSDDGEHATEMFRKATELRTFDAELWYRLARAYLEQGQKPAALAAAKKAFQLNDARVEFQVFAADLSMLAGDAPWGRKRLEEAVVRWPREPLPRMTLALAILREKSIGPAQRQRAEKLLREAVALAPTWPQPRVELARVFLQQKEPDAARQQLEQIAGPMLLTSEGGYLLSQAYNQLGRTEEGRRLADRYQAFTRNRLECTHLSYQADQAARDPQLHLRAARCLAGLGSPLAAARHYEAALRTSDPHSAIHREAEAALRQGSP